MPTNTSFAEEEWLAMGKNWADLPQHVKRQATQAFTIPTYTKQQILPAPNISIHQMTDFLLLTATVIIQDNHTSDFFSHYNADPIGEIMLTKMHQLPIVMCRAGLGLKPQAWAGLQRAWACEIPSPTLS